MTKTKLHLFKFTRTDSAIDTQLGRLAFPPLFIAFLVVADHTEAPRESRRTFIPTPRFSCFFYSFSGTPMCPSSSTAYCSACRMTPA